MATVLITGGTGMIGTALTRALLEKKYNVIILSRQTGNQQPVTDNPSYAQWNIHAQTIDKNAIIEADYIIHLAGAALADKRWTKKRRKEIVDSRVKSSELLVKTIKETPNKIKAIVSASGIDWYCADPVIPNPHPFTEDDRACDNFLGQTCKQWEESLQPVTTLGKRLVQLRTGIVLSNEGGAMKEFKKPLRFGVAPIMGTGRQVMSWIHIDDIVRMYIAAIENENMNGVYNAVAPNPASNKEFMLQLARVKKRKFFIPVHIPSFMLKLFLGEMSIMVLKSTTGSCDKIRGAGFSFLYPSLETSLVSLQ